MGGPRDPEASPLGALGPGPLGPIGDFLGLLGGGLLFSQ